nr:MAK10-like protein [Tanacetum cinerariifolium]
MGDKNPIRTLGDYSKPSLEGYKNTIELPVGNNMVPLRPDTIRIWLERLLAGSITTWEDLTTRFLAQLFPPERTAKLRSLDYEKPDIEQLLGVMECKVDTLIKEAISLMGRSKSIFGMASNTVYQLPSEPSRREEFENLVMNFILDQKEKVKQLEEYMGVIGRIPIEVKPLEETPLEDLGLNTCNHDIPLSSREIPNFDEPEPQPQPLPNYPSLDVSLGSEKGLKPPIKLHSLDSLRMKVVDNLTIHIPPSPHVAPFHLMDMYCYHHPCLGEPNKHYGFKPGLLGQGGSLGVDLSN